MNRRHFQSVAISYTWRNHYHPLFKALLASPNASVFSFFSSSAPIDSPESRIPKLGDQSPSVISILDQRIQSGKVINQPRSSKSNVSFGSLAQRIFKERDPSLSVASILDEWIEKGLEVNLNELHNLTKKLRQQCRFSYALQISEWMAEQRGCDLSAKHFAVRLDLISKVHGLEKAEEFFSHIPDSSKDYQVNVVLLICYAHGKQLEKAEALMQKMRDMDLIKTAYSYNIMLNLYSKMGKYEKLDVLIHEMERKGIKLDTFTYEIRLHAYGALGDIEGMENFLEKIKMDQEIEMSFRAFSFAAYGYIKAGLVDKAVIILQNSEHLAKRNLKRYEKLLTLYAAAGNKTEVYRIWNLYKQNSTFYYKTGYISMIGSLVKLDDMDGAEKIWEEWDSAKMRFDIRIPNLMIYGLSRKGFCEKAEEIIYKIIERGKEPNVASWDGLATGYLLAGRMLEAVETMKKAICASKLGQKPSLLNLAVCLKYLEGQGYKEEAEEVWKMINEHCRFSTDEYNRLFCLVKDENLSSNAVLLQMQDDQFSVEPPTALEFSDKGVKVLF